MNNCNTRILLISSELFNKTGGGLLTRSYLKIIGEIVGEKNLIPFSFPRRHVEEEINFNGYIVDEDIGMSKKIWNAFFRNDPLISRKVEHELIQIIKRENINVIFLARSTQGKLIKNIKKYYSIPIIVLFIDIYPEVLKTKWKNNKLDFLFHLPLYRRIAFAEKYSVKHATASIVLNERERKNFFKYYKINPDHVIPISCDDVFDKKLMENSIKKDNLNEFILCFIGSYFPPNINGIKWFVTNVMPGLKANIVLQIVGNRMEKLKNIEMFNKTNIQIIGTVDSLNIYYANADIIIAPIFEGTGMKTKTAEALMFGKLFLGTEEALCGYDDLEGFCCNTSDEFIRRINYYEVHRPEKYLPSMRKLYEQKYSVEATKYSIECLIETINNN